MNNWQYETGKYLPKLEDIYKLILEKPEMPVYIPSPPLSNPPTLLQSLIYKSLSIYSIGVLGRTDETLSAIICLWKEGFIAEAASLSRLLYEIWGIAFYNTRSLKKYTENQDISKLEKVINKIHEGVRSEVLMPWGTLAAEEPIHIMDTIRELKKEFPTVMTTYDDLCESAHANQPRYFEWWLIGKYGNNWTNQTVQIRGHKLLEKTISSLEFCIKGIKETSNEGYELCGELYEHT